MKRTSAYRVINLENLASDKRFFSSLHENFSGHLIRFFFSIRGWLSVMFFFHLVSSAFRDMINCWRISVRHEEEKMKNSMWIIEYNNQQTKLCRSNKKSGQNMKKARVELDKAEKKDETGWNTIKRISFLLLLFFWRKIIFALGVFLVHLFFVRKRMKTKLVEGHWTLFWPS